MMLPESLRLVLITDGLGDVPRLLRICRAAVDAGIQAIQLREPGLVDEDLVKVCAELKTLPVLLLSNNRADLPVDGVHWKQSALPLSGPLSERLSEPLSDARPHGQLQGVSVHNAGELQRALQEEVDYLILAPVFATTSKPGVAPLGIARTRELVQLSPKPVILLGGMQAENLTAVRECGAFGAAVMSAIFAAQDPGQAAKALLEALA